MLVDNLWWDWDRGGASILPLLDLPAGSNTVDHIGSF